MSSSYLFAYGTLKDPDTQRKLFGDTFDMIPARLEGWALYQSSEDDYLFIKPDLDSFVEGELFKLDNPTLAIADEWEEVPYYQREIARVITNDDRMLETWVYTRRDGKGNKVGS